VNMGRDIVVVTATSYGLDGLGIESRWMCNFPHPPIPPGTHTASHEMGTGSLLRREKWTEREVDHPPHLAPRLKKE
jgi:hypothetical protein